MVGDSVTHISLRIHKSTDKNFVSHVGLLRRGHACIDWTLKGALTVPPVVFDNDGMTYPLKAVGRSESLCVFRYLKLMGEMTQ